MYTYKAIVERVVDGDTLDLLIDCGFHVHVRERVRLYGINTPETRGPERELGEVCKRHLDNVLSLTDYNVTVKTSKGTGKYGRWLAEILVEREDDVAKRWLNLNHDLVIHGYAKEYHGEGPIPRFDPSEPYPLTAPE